MAHVAPDQSARAGAATPAKRRLLIDWSALLVIATVLAAGLLLSGATTRLDDAIYDFGLKLRPRPAPADIVIVAIDFPSMSKQGRWPWPRAVQAAMLRNIASDHPRSIACDILFQSNGPQPGDRDVHDAMSLAPVFLPEVLETPGRGHAGSLTRPIPEIASAAVGLGRTSESADADGIVRRSYLTMRYQGQTLPQLMTLVARQPTTRLEPYYVENRADSVHNAIDRSDEILIPFAGPPGHFQQVSASDVIEGRIPAGVFQGKNVLVGATAPGLLDNYPTPVSDAEGMPNIEVEANILDGILHRHLIRQVPTLENLLLTLGVVWVLFFGMLRLNPNQIVVQGPLGSLLFVGASIGSLILFGLWFDPVPALITRTLVQITWSSLRLQAASDYFARELEELQTRAGGALVPIRRMAGLPLGDSVSRQMALIDETRTRLRELRRFVADVLANFPDPVLVVSPRGRIITVNQSAADLGRRLGRSTEPGSQIQPILDDLEAAAGGVDRLWPPMMIPPLHAPRGVGPSGRILEARYTPTGRDGVVAKGWTVHLVDVTSLVSAMRQREEALELFTHDMRSAQSAILAALEHQDFRSVAPSIRENIERNALRTLSLADGFVRLAQAETTEYAFSPIDVFHVLGDAADALWSVAQSADVEIQVNDPEREFVIDADRGLLSRAFVNLLDNAIKFSPPGMRVECTLSESRLHGRAAVCCTISDRASGMSQDQQESLFKRFARSPLLGAGDEGRPMWSNSIGRGLAVVHTVVTRHDGVVDCHRTNDGTVFTITLPLMEIDEFGDTTTEAVL